VLDYNRVDFTTRSASSMSCSTLSTGTTANGHLRSYVPVTSRPLSTAPMPNWLQGRGSGIHLVGVTVEPDYVGLETLTALVDNGQLSVHVTDLPFERRPTLTASSKGPRHRQVVLTP